MTVSLSNGQWWAAYDLPLGGYEWRPVRQHPALAFLASQLDGIRYYCQNGPYEIIAHADGCYELSHWGIGSGEMVAT
jgi:hypothetical protein